MKFPLPRTLHMRIMLAISLLQLVVVGLFSVYMMAQLVSNEVTNRQALGNKMISLAAPAAARLLAENNSTALREYLDVLVADATITSSTIKNKAGAVIYFKAKPQTRVHPIARTIETPSLNSRITTELKLGGASYGFISVELSSIALNENIRTLINNLLYLVLILLAIDLLATELLIKFFVAPLGPLTMMARDVSQGNWDTTVQPSERASEEVRHLANAFIESAKIMRKQIKELEQTRTQLAQNETRLRNLVNNMQEVLLELDKTGRIEFLNPVWETLTGYPIESSIGKFFSSYLLQPQHQIHFGQARLEHIGLYDLQLELRAQNGEHLWLQMNTTLQYNSAGEFDGIISTLEDVSETLRLQSLQREHEQDLYKLTITDPLTGVYNRRHFDEMLASHLHLSLNKGQQLALLIVDIDGFKFINDTYGHPVGDQVLKSLARTIADEKRQGDALARLAGDEFAVILQDTNEADAYQIAVNLHKKLGAISIPLEVGQLQVQTSIGVAMAPLHGKTPQDLIRSADVALYHAKKNGRNRVDTLSTDMGAAIMDIFSQGFELRNALASGMIAAFMQPIVELKTGEVIAYEVLSRLRRGNQYVAAEEYVLIAEDLGLIREMDLYVIEQALMNVPKHIHLFLNISLSSFYAPEFAAQLKDLLQSPIARERPLTLEFTERQTTDLSESFIQLFDELRLGGCNIALDDFGVGYSTYDYLRRLKPAFVKIDGSFVQQIRKNPQDAKIVEHIRDLSETFGAQAIAEHVEDKETLQLLMHLGVLYGQGYYFGKPTSITAHGWKAQLAG